jgi:hypothetical protein
MSLFYAIVYTNFYANVIRTCERSSHKNMTKYFSMFNNFGLLCKKVNSVNKYFSTESTKNNLIPARKNLTKLSLVIAVFAMEVIFGGLVLSNFDIMAVAQFMCSSIGLFGDTNPAEIINAYLTTSLKGAYSLYANTDLMVSISATVWPLYEYCSTQRINVLSLQKIETKLGKMKGEAAKAEKKRLLSIGVCTTVVDSKVAEAIESIQVFRDGISSSPSCVKQEKIEEKELPAVLVNTSAIAESKKTKKT